MSEPSTTNSELRDSSGIEDEAIFMDFLIVFVKYKALTIIIPFLIAVIAAGYSLTLPNTFTANTKLLPPQGQSSTLAQQISGLAGLAGLVGGGGALKSGSDIYVAMLKSRSLADNLIQRFGLMSLWAIDPKHPADAYGKLEGVTTILTGKDGTITIEVSAEDPKQAADFANAYVEELFKFTSVIAVTEASKRRLFFEQQFALAKDNLAKAEIAARQALQGGGLIKVDEQGRAVVEVTARLRGQITVKEVQIGAMRTFAADRNPDLQMALQELESLKRELAKAEGSSGDVKSEKAGKEGQGIDNLGLLRDVKYYEVIYELLARQYEVAKIDEAKEGAVIQVLDKAIVPDRRSGPKRTYMVLVSAIIAGFLGLISAFALESAAKDRNNPKRKARLQSLKRYLMRR